MGSISVEQFLEHPEELLFDAHDGVIAVVTQDGEPVFMAVPMGANLDSPRVRLELAVSLFDREQVSIGVASRIAHRGIVDQRNDRRARPASDTRDALLRGRIRGRNEICPRPC